MSGFGQKKTNTTKELLKSIAENCKTVNENVETVKQHLTQSASSIETTQVGLNALRTGLAEQKLITKSPTAGTTPFLDLLFTLPGLFLHYPVQAVIGTGVSIGLRYGLKKLTESGTAATASAPSITNITNK